MGSDRGLRQLTGSRLCPDDDAGWPGDSGACVSHGAGWVESAVLEVDKVWKAVDAIPESGVPWDTRPSTSVNAR